MKIASSNRMGDTVTVGTGRNATSYRVTPGARRALTVTAARYRDAIIVAAVAACVARNDSRVWDIDIAYAVGVPMTPDAVAAWRRDHGIPRPSCPWPGSPYRTPELGAVNPDPCPFATAAAVTA